MSIFANLTDWIQPQHLDPLQIEAYKDRFVQHPAGAIQIYNFFKEDRIEQVANYLIKNGTYKPHYALFSVEKYKTSQENWDAAEPSDLFFTYETLQAFPEALHEDEGYLLYQQLRKMYLRPDFYKYIGAMTGIPLIGTRIEPLNHMRLGHFIRPHTDHHESRRLTFLIYLAPDWKPEYGGQLNVHGRDKSTTTIEAVFNSCVIFDIKKHKTHEVTDILPTAGHIGRMSLACRLHESKKKK